MKSYNIQYGSVYNSIVLRGPIPSRLSAHTLEMVSCREVNEQSHEVQLNSLVE